MYSNLGVIASSFGRGVISEVLGLVLNGNIVTASYIPLSGELNKPPYINDVTITSSNGVFQVGSTLTATIDGKKRGPFTTGTHLYQWYRLSALYGGTLTAIVGATNSTYLLVTGDLGLFIVCAARFVQVQGANNLSDWFYSIPTVVIEAATAGDINHAWADFFDIETGASVPSNWNDVGISPSLINLGSGADWTTAEATKPTFSTNKLVFANAHRVAGYSATWPPVYEVWIKMKFTGGAGNVLCQGNQLIFGNNSSNQYSSAGMPLQTGDLNEHVFRIVMNGISSKFQVDKGTEVTFDESTTSGNTLVMGQTNSGGAPLDGEIKRFQRTADSVILTAQEVSDKWLYHGFP